MVPAGQLEIIGVEESWELLATADVARIALVSGSQLQLVPVNILVNGGQLLVRTAISSMLAEAAAHSSPLVLEADHLEPALRVGWSVVVHGFATLWPDDSRLAGLPWPQASPLAGQVVVCITPTAITGRRIVPGRGGSREHQVT